jgi:hypothetical protein
MTAFVIISVCLSVIGIVLIFVSRILYNKDSDKPHIIGFILLCSGVVFMIVFGMFAGVFGINNVNNKKEYDALKAGFDKSFSKIDDKYIVSTLETNGDNYVVTYLDANGFLKKKEFKPNGIKLIDGCDTPMIELYLTEDFAKVNFGIVVYVDDTFGLLETEVSK